MGKGVAANVHTRALIPLVANCIMGGLISKHAMISCVAFFNSNYFEKASFAERCCLHFFKELKCRARALHRLFPTTNKSGPRKTNA